MYSLRFVDSEEILIPSAVFHLKSGQPSN